jgi:hypothetical protein
LDGFKRAAGKDAFTIGWDGARWLDPVAEEGFPLILPAFLIVVDAGDPSTVEINHGNSANLLDSVSL